MIVSINIPAETRRKIGRDSQLAAKAEAMFARAVLAGAETGAERTSELLQRNELPVKNRHGGMGLAGSIIAKPLGGVGRRAGFGVFADAPASRYAAILERGGVIRPKTARALAVPISDEARGHTSPRDMDNLVMIKRPGSEGVAGKPSLLVEKLSSRGGRRAQWRIHWVLVKSVTMPAFAWLTAAADMVGGDVRDSVKGEIRKFTRQW